MYLICTAAFGTAAFCPEDPGRRPKMLSQHGHNGFTAAIIRINVVSDKAYLEITTAAYGLTGSRYIIQIFRNHEFDTFYKYIAA